MVFRVETGVGIQGANSLGPIEFIDAYLAERNRSTENTWSARSTPVKQAAAIAATDYITKRFGARFRGQPRAFVELPAEAAITITAQSTTGETITVGGVAIDMDRGADLTAAAAAIAEDINAGVPEGISFVVRSASSDGAVLALVAAAPGVQGNYVGLIDGTGGDVTLPALFSGGLEGGPHTVSFPRDYLYDAFGNPIVGVPLLVLQAWAEYSVRAVAAVLLPDPTVHASGRIVSEAFQKVGPIEERYRFAAGASLEQIIKPYPAADSMLAAFLKSSGGVIRA